LVILSAEILCGCSCDYFVLAPTFALSAFGWLFIETSPFSLTQYAGLGNFVFESCDKLVQREPITGCGAEIHSHIPRLVAPSSGITEDNS